MNAKNRLIEKLLQVAKKHKILTYPVLALVAVISVFHYFFSWSTGAGKRIVAVVMVLVMLVSQSCFLTSSATALVDTEETIRQQQELQAESEEGLVNDSDTTEETTGDGLVVSETPTEVVTEDPAGGLDNGSEEVATDVADSSEETNTTVESDDTLNTEDSAYVESETENTTNENVTGDDSGTEEIPAYTEEVGNSEREGEITVLFQAGSDYVYDCKAASNGDGTYTIASWETVKGLADTNLVNNHNKGIYVTYEGWYSDKGCTTKVDSSNVNMLRPVNGQIWLYAKQRVENYEVTIKPGGKSEMVTYETSDEATFVEDGIYAVGATSANGSYTGNFTINAPTRTGYKLNAETQGVTDTSAGVKSEIVGENLNVSLSGADYQKSFELDWVAEQYDITYATTENGDGEITQTVTYDGSSDVLLSGDAVSVADKSGYEFAGWKTKDGNIVISEKDIGGTLICEIPGLQSYAYNCAKNNRTPAVLQPVYRYSGVELNRTTIEYQYKGIQNQAYVVSVAYSGEENPSDIFSYELGKITTADGKEVTDAKDAYGININAKTDTGVSVGVDEGAPTEVVTLKVEVKVTDARVTEEDLKTSTKSFTIKVNPCVLVLDTSDIKDNLTKTYDGNDTCAFAGTVKTKIDGVTVNVESSRYESPDAGDRTVYMTLADDWLEGDDEKNYVKPGSNEMTVNGHIDKAVLKVRTTIQYTGGRNYARAGESDNPKKGYELLDGYKFATEQDEKNADTFIKLEEEPARTDTDLLTGSKTSQTYRVLATETEDSNYDIQILMEDAATYEVRIETPNSTYYKTSEPANEFGWYRSGVYLLPTEESGYSMIRLKGSADGGVPQVELSEDNMTDGYMNFQLLDSTGAFTRYTSVRFDVDGEAPVYAGCEMSAAGGEGLFFPAAGGQESLGHYFNTELTFKVYYNDPLSNPYKLYYTLGGTLGGNTGAVAKEALFEVNAEGKGVATFSIPLAIAEEQDKKGGIQFYAVDKAGNESDAFQLVKSGDVWIVEDTLPEAELTIKSGGNSATDGITIKGENRDTYYGNVVAYLSAKDNTSPIKSITWIINDKEYEQPIDFEQLTVNRSLSIKAASIAELAGEFTPESDGTYSVAVYVTDMAGNSSKVTDTVIFKVDEVLPEVTIDDGYKSYQQKVKLTFNAYDELSGIKYINVKDAQTGEMIEHVVESVEENRDGKGYITSYCYIETTEQGVYIIEVSDKAGNVFTSEEIVLDMVSDELPACPEVTFLPEVNENGWITSEEAIATIQNVKRTTEDNIPVYTKYQLWKDGQTSMHVTTLDSDADDEEITLPNGVYTLRVWSESATGVLCLYSTENGHEYPIRVDSVVPEIEYSLQKGADNTLIVNFTVTDDTSGVNGETIQVFKGTQPVATQVTALEDGSGYTGSFVIKEVGSYSISAKDIAGNTATAPTFKPMSMRVNALKNISSTAVTVGAHIYKGTYPIESASISYRKFTDAGYKETDALPILDEMTGDMSVSAVLDGLEEGTNYVYKVTAVSEGEEILEHVGYFRTLSDREAGITISGTTRYADGREAAITVGLFAGNSCIRAVEIDTSVSNTFTFNNVPDGNYSIVATDGEYSKTKRVLIEDGIIIYPDHTIDLVLSGKNTSVIIKTDETPNISADNMDSLFNDEINFTDEDADVIANGGTVEFQLIATLMRVSDVTAEQISVMYAAATNKNKIVGAYLDLSVEKVITYPDGSVERKKVTELANGANISVTIPLGDLADESGLEIIRIHDTGERFLGSYLADQDNNPSTYTIASSLYSVYAILYDPEKREENVTPTTEAISDGTLNPSDSGTINKSTEEIDDGPDEDDSDNGKGNTKKPASGGSSVGSLRSSGSAKTGDTTPIVMLFGIMGMSLVGFVLLRKKSQD